MDEYIKRETAVRAVMAAKWVDGSDGAMAMEIVASPPAADVAPVVRCKDCKHRIYKNMGDEIGEIGGCGLFNCAMPNEGFCSHGKRKDGGDD